MFSNSTMDSYAYSFIQAKAGVNLLSGLDHNFVGITEEEFNNRIINQYP